MQKRTAHKEIYDPLTHYVRGILYFDGETFTFTSYREPYRKLNNKKWETEQAFMADYRRLIAGNYPA